MQAYVAGSVIATKAWREDCFVILFSGDNFNVPYSFNLIYKDFKEEYLKDTRDFKNELKQTNSKSILFTGGEPCLQRQALLDISRFSKRMGVYVGIETNGSKPDCLRSLLKENLLDFIALDIKTPLKEDVFEKITKSRTFFITPKQIIDDIKESLKLLKEYSNKVDIEIRTTIVPGIMYKKEDILGIASEIKDIECRWTLQQFNPNNVVDKKFNSLNPPTERFLDNLKQTCQKKYPNIRIDIFTENRDYYTIEESD
ncbi:radical SAM protein [Candidatus Woesearchaeota archaeon]|nr:radical SAM protein [Candidatus Woesearchaeota archaeon]